MKLLLTRYGGATLLLGMLCLTMATTTYAERPDGTHEVLCEPPDPGTTTFVQIETDDEPTFIEPTASWGYPPNPQINVDAIPGARLLWLEDELTRVKELLVEQGRIPDPATGELRNVMEEPTPDQLAMRPGGGGFKAGTDKKPTLEDHVANLHYEIQKLKKALESGDFLKNEHGNPEIGKVVWKDQAMFFPTEYGHVTVGDVAPGATMILCGHREGDLNASFGLCLDHIQWVDNDSGEVYRIPFRSIVDELGIKPLGVQTTRKSVSDLKDGGAYPEPGLDDGVPIEPTSAVSRKGTRRTPARSIQSLRN